MARRLKTYSTETIDVHYDRQRCIHAAECGRAAGELFVGKREPWCDPSMVPVDEAVDVVERCPTGALLYDRKDGGGTEAPPAENSLHIAPAGPVYVRGDLEVRTPDGQTSKETRIALCRCGASKNKPYCDNAHKRVEFHDQGPVARSTPAEVTPAGGEVILTVFANGPVQVKGEVALYSGAGRLAERSDEVYLCRCGQSANRPFCDGTHKRIDFKPDD